MSSPTVKNSNKDKVVEATHVALDFEVGQRGHQLVQLPGSGGGRHPGLLLCRCFRLSVSKFLGRHQRRGAGRGETKNAIKLNLHRQISMFHFFSCSNVFFTALWEQEVGLTWARAQSSPARPEGFPRSAARRLCLGLRRRHRVWASPRQVAPSCLRWRLRSPGSGGGQRAAGELLPLLQRRMTLYFNTGVCGALVLFVEITKNHCIRF